VTTESRPSLFRIGGLVAAGLLVLAVVTVCLFPIATCTYCFGSGAVGYRAEEKELYLHCSECDGRGKTSLLAFRQSPHREGRSPFNPPAPRYPGKAPRFGD
jgi:hypothetical protein